MVASDEYVIETRNLTRIYGDGAEIWALDKVSLKVRRGELITVMGPSGSGKSTLLNLIGALDKPTSGQVFIEGQDLQEIRNKDEFRSKMVGFVFQLHNLIPTLTARENIEVPMMGHMSGRERHNRSIELLNLVGLEDRMKHLPNQLSGGQRQRVAVARALANNPFVVLADEPTGSLDTTAGGELMDLINDLNRSRGTTFIHALEYCRYTSRYHLATFGYPVQEGRNRSLPIFLIKTSCFFYFTTFFLVTHPGCLSCEARAGGSPNFRFF